MFIGKVHCTSYNNFKALYDISNLRNYNVGISVCNIALAGKDQQVNNIVDSTIKVVLFKYIFYL